MSRLATFTVSPMAVMCSWLPPPKREATIGPKCAPILKPSRDEIGVGRDVSQDVVREQRPTHASTAWHASSSPGSGKPKRIMAPVAHEARDETVATDRFLINETVKLFQQRTGVVRSERLAQPGEAGQIHENDRRLLAHGLAEKVRISREAFC